MKAAYHFRGISLLVPTQREHELVPLKKRISHKIPKESGSFKVIRPIANLALVKKADLGKHRKEYIKNFDPPLEILVGYTRADVEKCGGDIHQLKLANWDGSRWVVISNHEHEYFILPPGTARVAGVKIASWAGDPPLAWGK